MKALILAVLFATFAPATSAAALLAPVAGQAQCTADDTLAREGVVELLTSQALASFRQEYGITQVDPSHLRLLTDAQDAALCSQLRNRVNLASNTDYQPYNPRPVYYKADGFIFVAVALTPPSGHVLTMQTPLAVLDSSLNVRGVIGM